MNLGKLESQIHESQKVGDSWLFMGFMTLSGETAAMKSMESQL